MKNVQLCCGYNRIEGWENYDQDMDVTKPLRFGNSSVDTLLIEHGVEHFNTHEILRLFQECHRVLKPGGKVRICVPSLGKITDREHAKDLILSHGHQMVFSPASLRYMLWAAGFERSKIYQTGRSPLDNHWRSIGIEKDEIETIRCEAQK